MIRKRIAALAAEAAWQLGPRPVLLAAWHRSPAGRAVARRRLARPPRPSEPGAVLPDPPPPAPEGLPRAHCAALLGRALAAAAPRGGWHGDYPPGAPALGLDLFGAGDIRPVWEANRWAELPLLAQAARLDPGGGHLARAEALLADWQAANPPWRGPNWACGQEAALRALHLGLALGLLGGGTTPSRAAQSLLALHGRRIAATPAYALAQDNNHTVSEPAGLLACGLLCAEPGWVRAGAAGLEAALLRLVSPCGAFAQASTGYHRLLLDVVSAAAWLAARLGGPALSGAARQRLAAAALWLGRLTDPGTGATPVIGHQDGSAFADLALAGPTDARASVERAALLFAGRSAGWPGEPGCAWLGLAPPGAAPPDPWGAEPAWQSEGFRGWRAGAARAVLRTGAPRLRFRPGQADLLHLDLWDGPLAVLRDGGTGSYNAPPGEAWWHAHFTGTAAHNTIAFDDADQMPRAGRFLFLRWPRTGLLPAGAWLRDHRGNRHARQVRHDAKGQVWTVEDEVCGPFRQLALRWRLAPGAAWAATADGAAGPAGRIGVSADAPLAIALEDGWESPAYGAVVPAPVLVARAAAPVSRLASLISLAGRPARPSHSAAAALVAGGRPA